MIELFNKTTLEIDTDFLETIVLEFTKREIELIITDNVEIQALNKEFRAINKDTDVLSFPLEDFPFTPLGSIVISEDHVKAKAKEHGHSVKDEYTLLFIHGLLHLLGFDHETDDEEMRKEEERLVEHYNLPKSLIVRTVE
ncbi:MAG: rRNA maturation RNase YbeY [Sulfurimonadaceae bacterium]|jgi:probable rRNA maturation factor|nr:rRNA maturation RNase YbeY [Sulfurimonadaceae bacterium]